jgi:hypothetical protein
VLHLPHHYVLLAAGILLGLLQAAYPGTLARLFAAQSPESQREAAHAFRVIGFLTIAGFALVALFGAIF